MVLTRSRTGGTTGGTDGVADESGDESGDESVQGSDYNGVNQEGGFSSDDDMSVEYSKEEFDMWWSIHQPAAGGDDGEQGDISLEQIRDGIVATKTYVNYISDIVQFIKWAMVNRPAWVTEHGKGRLQYIFTRSEGESCRDHGTRLKDQMKVLLRQAVQDPVMNLDAITPQAYMVFVMGLRHGRTGGYLSKSAYNSKRSALYHLYRLHNKRGYSENFKSELGSLYRGFHRRLQERRPARVVDAGDGQGPAAQRAWHTEGKEPMSVELYELLAKGFLEWNTIDGVFGFAFLVLSWNLACRSSNTAGIRLSELTWTSFDAFEVFFAHSKTDQTGSDAKYARHCFANSNNPLFCPVFALACYFSCCVNTQQSFTDPLFPGTDQHERFGDALHRLMRELEPQINLLGYQIHDIGTHSIRKGAVSYLASLVGGPPAAAVCIRSGHSMGQVKDIYMRYIQAGDEFVGRCLSLAPILSDTFGNSPPFFTDEYDGDATAMTERQYPMLVPIIHLRKMLKMCCASLLYHRRFVDSLSPNHVVVAGSQALREQDVLEEIQGNDVIKVTKPWNDTAHAFSGIPPHVAVLHRLALIRTEQQTLIDGFVGNVKQAIEESGVGGVVPGARLDRMFAQLQERLDAIQGPMGGAAGGGGGGSGLRNDRRPKFNYHLYGGQFHRLPKNWRFPRVGVLALWRQWWIGDTVKHIPPLRDLRPSDFKHLDDVDLGTDELHGRTGSFKANRRKSNKMFSDLSFLMEYCTAQVELKGALVEEITVQSVDDMFMVIADEFGESGKRNAQKRWTTHVKETRKKLRQLAAANNTVE